MTTTHLIGDGKSKQFTIYTSQHKQVPPFIIQVQELLSGSLVLPSIAVDELGNISVEFHIAPAGGSHRVIIHSD